MRLNGMLHLLITIALLAPAAMAGSDIYVKAVVDPGGEQLQITTKDGRTISLKKEKDQYLEQVGYGAPVISEDGKAVGWTAMFKVATSYPVPWDLVIYSAGKMHHLGVGGGMPIAEWRFEARGKQVAFRAETLHGPARQYYVLSDTATGRMIARYGPYAYGPDADDADRPDKPLPKWAEGLNEKK
jgi:hypothetical protein